MIASAGFSEKGDTIWTWVIGLWPIVLGVVLFVLLILGTFVVFWLNRKPSETDWGYVFRPIQQGKPPKDD